MNFCKDCKHVTKPFFRDHCCSSPNLGKRIDVVTGEPEKRYHYCDTIRGDRGLCGPEGSWFAVKGK